MEENRDLNGESNRLPLHRRPGAEAKQNPGDAVGTRLGTLWAKTMMSDVSKQDLFQVFTMIIVGKNTTVTAAFICSLPIKCTKAISVKPPFLDKWFRGNKGKSPAAINLYQTATRICSLKNKTDKCVRRKASSVTSLPILCHVRVCERPAAYQRANTSCKY